MAASIVSQWKYGRVIGAAASVKFNRNTRMVCVPHQRRVLARNRIYVPKKAAIQTRTTRRTCTALYTADPALNCHATIRANTVADELAVAAVTIRSRLTESRNASPVAKTRMAVTRPASDGYQILCQSGSKR